jgi:hypothetical protein
MVRTEWKREGRESYPAIVQFCVRDTWGCHDSEIPRRNDDCDTLLMVLTTRAES